MCEAVWGAAASPWPVAVFAALVVVVLGVCVWAWRVADAQLRAVNERAAQVSRRAARGPAPVSEVCDGGR